MWISALSIGLVQLQSNGGQGGSSGGVDSAVGGGGGGGFIYLQYRTLLAGVTFTVLGGAIGATGLTTNATAGPVGSYVTVQI